MAQTIEQNNKQGIKKRAFTGWPMIIAWIGMLLFAFHASTHMVGAGDTWVALASGKHYVNHGVDTAEPFSTNSHHAGPTKEDVEQWPSAAKWIVDTVGLETVQKWHPTGWINQNWLTHVIFYWLSHESPFADADNYVFNTLVYWKFVIYILAIICVYYIGRTIGVNPALSAVFACFSMFIGRSFFDIRPAGFSNLLVAVYLLILVLTTYKNHKFIWLLVPLSIFWGNVHGGYIYLFIMLAPFVFFHIISKLFKNKFVTIGWRGIFHTIGAGAAALIATIIFNPYHLTNLTHTFIISISEHAEMWRTVNEWHPAFEWDNPVGDEIPFLIMFIMAIAIFVAWIGIMIKTSGSVKKKDKLRSKGNDKFTWPKLDLAMLAVVALTIYMAVRSRRFIPLAAIAACPFMALYINQAIRAITATRNYRRSGDLTVTEMPSDTKKYLLIAGTMVVVFLGIWWGYKFKHIYLDSWPTDQRLTSMFQRMTASHAKPFWAGKFLRENKLKGNMFNYWTEGGFLAWVQSPDPNTGRIPLQLFMDGRAQAAYDVETYKLWSKIMTGGPPGYRARKRNSNDYKQVGKWVANQLRKRNIWLVIMPANQFGTAIVRGLEQNPQWRVVFMNNDQKIFVDYKTKQGKRIFDGILTGKTKYPTEFSRKLMLGKLLVSTSQKNEGNQYGLDLLIEACDEIPSQMPMRQIAMASRYSGLRKQAIDYCEKFIEDFKKNRQEYSKQNGFHQRIIAAIVADGFLQRYYQMKGNTEKARRYKEHYKMLSKLQTRVVFEKRW